MCFTPENLIGIGFTQDANEPTLFIRHDGVIGINTPGGGGMPKDAVESKSQADFVEKIRLELKAKYNC
jgi:hypothetical protein